MDKWLTLPHGKHTRTFIVSEEAPAPIERIFPKVRFRFRIFTNEWCERGYTTHDGGGILVEWAPVPKRKTAKEPVLEVLCLLILPLGAAFGLQGPRALQALLKGLETETFTEVNVRLLKAFAAGDV